MTVTCLHLAAYYIQSLTWLPYFLMRYKTILPIESMPALRANPISLQSFLRSILTALSSTSPGFYKLTRDTLQCETNWSTCASLGLQRNWNTWREPIWSQDGHAASCRYKGSSGLNLHLWSCETAPLPTALPAFLHSVVNYSSSFEITSKAVYHVSNFPLLPPSLRKSTNSSMSEYTSAAKTCCVLWTLQMG